MAERSVYRRIEVRHQYVGYNMGHDHVSGGVFPYEDPSDPAPQLHIRPVSRGEAIARAHNFVANKTGRAGSLYVILDVVETREVVGE